MSDTPLWMPLYVADYRNDTVHLSTLEHGAYLLLLMQAWSQGGALSSDLERLRRVAGMSPKEWKSAWPILRQFFYETPDGFRHRRVDAELSRYSDIVDKRREAGKAGAAKRWDGKRIANAMAEPLANEWQNGSQPQPQPQLEEEGQENIPLPHGALAFSGRVIRLNRRDFDEWAKRYSEIPDLTAELGALDDWLRDQDEAVRKKWFHVVSGSLSKKHQAAVNEAKALRAGHSGIPL